MNLHPQPDSPQPHPDGFLQQWAPGAFGPHISEIPADADVKVLADEWHVAYPGSYSQTALRIVTRAELR
jgi:hypothetical protein